MAGKCVLTEVILCPSFLGLVCGWVWLITGVQLMSNNSLSFSDLVAFVHISLCCVCALGSRLELPLLPDQSLVQSWLFPASLQKKRAANHLPPALIASWLHSLSCLKVQLSHGCFLLRNCRSAALLLHSLCKSYKSRESFRHSSTLLVRQKLALSLVPVSSHGFNQHACRMSGCILWQYCLWITM